MCLLFRNSREKFRVWLIWAIYDGAILQVMLHIGLQLHEQRTLLIACVLLQHGFDVLSRVFITGHLVPLLCAVSLCAVDFSLPLLSQQVAHFCEDGCHDGVEQVVSLNVEVGGLRRHAQSAHIVLCAQIFVLGIGKLSLQLAHFHPNLSFHVVE